MNQNRMFGPADVFNGVAPPRADWRARRISRREFFNRVAQAGAFAGIGQTHQRITEATVALKDALRRPYEVFNPAISDVLFSTQTDIRFLAGADHYKFNTVHPDNLRTIAPLVERYFVGRDLITYYDTQLIFSTSIDTSLGFVGGPRSSVPVQLILGYEPIEENPELGLQLINERVFKFAYEFALDARKLPKVRRLIKGEVHEVPNWSLVDTRSERSYDLISPTYEEGRLTSDYLLIIVLPNILSADTYEQGKRIALIMGTHGPGTLASLDVFATRDFVNLLARRTREHPYWQALIKVNNVHTDPETGTTIPADIDYEDFRIEPVGINQRVLMDGFVERSRALLTAGIARNPLDFHIPRDSVAKEQQALGARDAPLQTGIASRDSEGLHEAVSAEETMCDRQSNTMQTTPSGKLQSGSPVLTELADLSYRGVALGISVEAQNEAIDAFLESDGSGETTCRFPISEMSPELRQAMLARYRMYLRMFKPAESAPYKEEDEKELTPAQLVSLLM